MKVRKRTVVGSILVMGAIIGSLLSIRGLGTGGNGSDDAGSTLVSLDTASDVVPAPSSDADQPDPADVLVVRVVDRSYSVQRRGDGKVVFQPCELDQIVRRAQAAQGDELGIRVRIYRTQSARVSAWETLQHELQKAGLDEHSIQLVKGTVD